MYTAVGYGPIRLSVVSVQIRKLKLTKLVIKMNRLLLLLVAAVTSESVELTVDNFDDLVTEHSET